MSSKNLEDIQIRSVAQSCPTLCDPMNRSTPGLPVHHQLPEFTQTHVHRVSDAIQPSHPLSSPSPLAANPSQHQSLFQWVNSSAKLNKSNCCCCCCLVTKSCQILCNPMDCNLPGSSVNGIFQARMLEMLAISFSRASSWPRDWTLVSCLAGRFFTDWATREAL